MGVGRYKVSWWESGASSFLFLCSNHISYQLPIYNRYTRSKISIIMSPIAEINQQPQAGQMEMTPQTSNGVVSQQPVCRNPYILIWPCDGTIRSSILTNLFLQGQAQSMTADPEVGMRGGGAVGDWYVTSCSWYGVKTNDLIVVLLSVLSNAARIAVNAAARCRLDAILTTGWSTGGYLSFWSLRNDSYDLMEYTLGYNWWCLCVCSLPCVFDFFFPRAPW